MREILELITKKLQENKNLNNLSKEFLKQKIKNYFLREGQKEKKLKLELERVGIEKLEKNKLFKQILKEIKTEINHQYTIFLTSDFSKKQKIINYEEILQTHKSSKERFPFYEEIYNKIFSWHKPKKIADLACGLNPISYILIENILNYKPKYFASDLAEKDMEFLNSFFEQNKIPGIAKAYDLTNENFLNEPELKDCDLIFLFKALDSIEEVKRHYSKILLEKLPAKHLVVSFPTKSIGSGKDFDIKKRNWFYKYLEKQKWQYQEFQVENEWFFLIEKKQQ
ncbi:MAG: hypothetical protein ACOCXG_01565 [Nanoarchaeota archaeon]